MKTKTDGVRSFQVLQLSSLHRRILESCTVSTIKVTNAYRRPGHVAARQRLLAVSFGVYESRRNVAVPVAPVRPLLRVIGSDLTQDKTKHDNIKGEIAHHTQRESGIMACSAANRAENMEPTR